MADQKTKSSFGPTFALAAAGAGVVIGGIVYATRSMTGLDKLLSSSSASSSSSQPHYRFVFLDLDGTTLNTQHKISEKNKRAIRSLVERGVGVAIATGRSMCGIYEHLEALKLPKPIPVLCLNGALALRCTWDGKSTELFTDSVPKKLCVEVTALAAEFGLVPQFYIKDKIYAIPKTKKHLELMKRYECLAGHAQDILSDAKELENLGTPAKMLILTEDPDGLIEAARERLGDALHLVRGSPDPFFVEFLAKGVCKGSGLLKLCQKEKINPKQTVAFGDGDNDMEFLQNAGFGCAMKNARKVTKEKADLVLEWTNDEDGVAMQLSRMQDQGLL